MKTYTTEQIRNLCLVGHSGVGKTSLVEVMLNLTGVTKRIGKIDDGNTVSDFSKEEIKRGSSINTSVIPIEWDNHKVNLIDAPGYFDFKNEVYSALRASEAALVVIDSSNGIEVGTEKFLNYTKEIQLPRIIFVNKMEKENANLNKIVSDLHINYDKKVIPFTLTIGEGEDFVGLIDVLNKKAYEYDGFTRKEIPIPENRVDEVEVVYGEIVEIVAESDEELMNKYFEGESFNHEELMEGITSALLDGSAVPLVAGSSDTGAGIDILLDTIVQYMPAPSDERAKYGFRLEDGKYRGVHLDEPLSAVVFKTIVDPFVGKISIFKVVSGKMTKDSEIYNVNKDKNEK